MTKMQRSYLVWLRFVYIFSKIYVTLDTIHLKGLPNEVIFTFMVWLPWKFPTITDATEIKFPHGGILEKSYVFIYYIFVKENIKCYINN